MSTLQQTSIIIPFAPDDMAWKDLLSDFESLPANSEIILVATSESTKTEASEFATPLPLRIICSALGRSLQMNAGAKAAKNPCLWFLHADSRVDTACLKALDTFDSSKKALGYFGLRFLTDGPRRMSINRFGVWFRSRFLKIPFGDQGFVISKSNFEKIGQYREDLVAGEDHAFVWAARNSGIKLEALSASIETSARKYKKFGWGKTTRLHLRETWRQARQFSRQAKNAMNGGLAIFVKTPGISPLKTRLAAGIGEASESWYGLAVEAVKSVALDAQKNCGISAYWAVAETDAMQNPLWQSLPRLAQAQDKQSDLGERMGRVMQMLIRQHGFGLLVGADTPQVCSRDIEAASDFLNHQQARLVLGPARDGGFWCVGSNRELPIELWQSVVYSQTNTYRDFVMAFSPYVEILNLRTLSDVDEVTDLAQCHSEIGLLENPTPEQFALLKQFSEYGLTA